MGSTLSGSFGEKGHLTGRSHRPVWLQARYKFSFLTIHSFNHFSVHTAHTSGSCVTYVIVGRIWVLLFTLISTVVIHVDLQRESITFWTIKQFIHFSDYIHTYSVEVCGYFNSFLIFVCVHLGSSVGLAIRSDGLQLYLLFLLLLQRRLLVVMTLLWTGQPGERGRKRTPSPLASFPFSCP